MKEYKIIEDQEYAKRDKKKIHMIRSISQRKVKEREKDVVNPLKLERGEIPDNILYQIDKLINEKMGILTEEVIKIMI